MKELKKLLISNDDIKQMSAEQLEELNSQYGWFADDIDSFKDLNECLYDLFYTDDFHTSLRSYDSGEKWEYFLPVKRLQEFIVMKLRNDNETEKAV